MEFKLKYGNNFSLVNGLQTFTITDTIKEGTIEVETIGNDSGIQITGYQFLISYNGQVLYPAPPSQNSSITFNFENFEGNWSIVARVFVQEQSGPDSTGEEVYEVPGNWKVVNSSGTGTGTGTGGGGASTIPNKLYQRFVSKIDEIDVEQGIIITKDNLSDKLDDRLSPKHIEFIQDKIQYIKAHHLQDFDMMPFKSNNPNISDKELNDEMLEQAKDNGVWINSGDGNGLVFAIEFADGSLGLVQNKKGELLQVNFDDDSYTLPTTNIDMDVRNLNEELPPGA